MTRVPPPLHPFSQRRQSDIPFEIGRIESLPPVAQSPLPHRHNFYEIIWITAGGGSHIIDFEAYPIQPETLYFITPGQVHSWVVEQPLSGTILLFTDDFLPGSRYDPVTPRSFDFFHRVDHRPVLALAADEARPFHDLCQHMLHEYQGEAYGRLTVLQASLHIFLVHAQRHYRVSDVRIPHTAADRLVEDTIRLIDLHFRERQQVHEYAALLGITSGHLTDTVRDRLGVPASHLIDQRIVLEAKRLLAYSDQTIAEIGYALKFDDPSYFTRFFRREAGLTPSQFRRSIREKYQTRRESSL